MKTGSITVTKAKNFIVTLTMENGKTQSPPATRFEETFIKKFPQNISVFYELSSSGSLALVSLDSDKKQIVFPIQNANQQSDKKPVHENTQQHINIPPMSDPARAPYNFVPLNKKVLVSNGITNYSKFEGLSGFIDIQIEAKSPLFIRGASNLFVNNDGQPYIPGSSLRGMVRNMVNITSFGKLKQFNNRTLFRRSNLTEDGTSVFPGFMQYTNGKYIIIKASAIQSNSIAIPYSYKFDILKKECKFSVGEFQHQCRVWHFTKQTDLIVVSDDAIDGYESDDTRGEGTIDILRSLKTGKIVDGKENPIGNVKIPSKIGVPVFYREDGIQAISFGHAKYHRIPYTHSIGDHIIQEKKSEPDFSESIFGTLDFPSKVFFEDCNLIGDPMYDLDSPKIPKVLSSPKPTTYQHYLEQPNPSNKKKWSDENAQIRGYKNYWHRQTTSEVNGQNTWVETGVVSNSNPEPINPISENSIFKGRIRFESLTNEELGALVFALDLPSGCCHKIGMGKPLGLGSVLISINKLSRIDRNKRYKTLINTGKWEVGVINETPNINSIKNNFAKYLCSQLPEVLFDITKGYMSLWDNDRLMKLREMLTFDHNLDHTMVNWRNRTRYMENGAGNHGVNEFRHRPILPTPDIVVKEKTYKKP